MIGRSSLFSETRIFHLGRILRIDATDMPYSIPRGFSLEKYFGNAWRMIREPGPDHEVVVRFSPTVAQNVSEVQWHKTQRIVPHPQDGSILFHAQVSGLDEISWWILGYGKEAEVLQPLALREKIRRHIEELVKLYVTEEHSALNPRNVPPSTPPMKHPLE